MYLGIEIGGTKLQLGVGPGDGTLVRLERRNVDISRGAKGIRDQIAAVGRELIAAYPVRAVGYGFGGPLNVAAGRTITSHQVAGWDDFPLAEWTEATLGVPAVLNNDCDAAALAEARFGAGAGRGVVFYITVGTGVGGGLVIDGHIYRGSRGVAAEIGHLRPGLLCLDEHSTVEEAVAGPGIVAAVKRAIEHFRKELSNPGEPIITKLRHVERNDSENLFPPTSNDRQIAENKDELSRDLARCESLFGDDLSAITAKDVFVAAAQGSVIARSSILMALRTLGWAVAQVITLLAPEVVVIGGGVSLAGEDAFFRPLRIEVAKYMFPPLLGTCEILPAALGEEVVVHGAIAAARDALASLA